MQVSRRARIVWALVHPCVVRIVWADPSVLVSSCSRPRYPLSLRTWRFRMQAMKSSTPRAGTQRRCDADCVARDCGDDGSLDGISIGVSDGSRSSGLVAGACVSSKREAH